MTIVAADFVRGLAICRAAVNVGGELKGNDLSLVIALLEFALNSLDTTAIMPPTLVEPVMDGQ